MSITKLLDELSSLGFVRSAGRLAERPGAPWLARSLPWAPWLARFGRPGRSWLAQDGSIWPRVARSGCPGRSGWLALDALGALGSPWLANDCPIDAISKKNRFAFRRSCFDAACFVRSGTFLHASNLVSQYRAVFCVEFDGDVCFCLVPPKSMFFFRSTFLEFFNVFPHPLCWGC